MILAPGALNGEMLCPVGSTWRPEVLVDSSFADAGHVGKHNPPANVRLNTHCLVFIAQME